MNIIAKLRAVSNTLDNVEVKGRSNMNRMLGSIQTIEEVIQELSASPTTAEEKEVANA